MKIPALIMAGGKGRRINSKIEKPLIHFLGKPLIDRVIKAARSAKSISEIYIITSLNTPQTEKKCVDEGLKILRTEGKGYHNDLRQAILEGKMDYPVLTMPSDLPAINGEFLDKIINIFEEKRKNALAVFVPLEKREELELSVSSKDEFKGKMYAVSGINVINGKEILSEGKIDTSAYISDEIEVLFNINTRKDLYIAEKTLKKILKN